MIPSGSGNRDNLGWIVVVVFTLNKHVYSSMKLTAVCLANVLSQSQRRPITSVFECIEEGYTRVGRGLVSSPVQVVDVLVGGCKDFIHYQTTVAWLDGHGAFRLD